MNRKLAPIALSIALAGGGLIMLAPGTSGAATTTSTTPAATAPANQNADANRPDPTARLTEVLKPLVDDGTLTQTQLDKVISTLESAKPADKGPRGGEHGPRGGGAGIETAATALGLTADELRTELESGKTVAQVATSNGVDVQTVIDKIVADETAKVTAKVTDGSITQTQADKRLADVTDRVTKAVNEGAPKGGPRGGHEHGGPDDAAPADAPAIAPAVAPAG